ncbi:MAG TPA: hypothetical protein VMT19_13175, partial [Thermoanaerobaculaceae bacterium]|nr:hypothetical protein [Thermoanaerobaculaceae bacterium]
MKRSLVATICFALVLLSVATVAPAKDPGGCRIHDVKGAWGYSETGTLYHPTLGAIPYASVG